MAGEIEEPIKLQLTSVHSGSVSFGRYENDDTLAWERSSPFPHNRYLEEVEKYSSPGSVTQKKAYFEAHFKKKALLRQASECQNGTECQTSDSDYLDQMSCMEDYEQSNAETRYDDEQSNAETRYDYEQSNAETHYDCEHSKAETHYDYEHSNAETHYAQCDESIDGSDDHEECEVIMICERECQEIALEFGIEHTIENPEVAYYHDSEHIEPAEEHRNHIECELPELLIDEVEEKQMLAYETKCLDGLPGSSDCSIPTTEKDHEPCIDITEKSPPEEKKKKVKATEETHTVKPKLKTQLEAAEGPIKSSSEASKDSAGTSRKMGRGSPLRTKTEKFSRQKGQAIVFTHPKTQKPEDSELVKAKQSQENRRKDQRAKSAGSIPQSSVPDKAEPRPRRSASRPKQTIDPIGKHDVKVIVPVFKSDERAEKRKEFYMKLEEKMHAKEAEMNQIQARTQEEAEAELKKLRKRLNFKAKPMPSFYQESVSRGSDGKKAITIQPKSTKSRSKSTSPVRRAATGSSVSSKPGSKQGTTLSESMRTPAQPQTSESTKNVSETNDSTQNPSANKNRAAQKRTESAGKKEKEKSKDANVQKQQGTDSSKVKKGEKIEGKRLGGRNSSSGMMRSMRKDVAICGNSGMECLPVGVAS
ncbi:protein WVD2-like 7 isoform X2 [Papaver somniferum]|uniref:protein WVD2-like 7 isoform X2 n=1 Tax=Papaver somniferum TaxID=3469 RepID=UPI000E6FC889|nr:protein WVD2-like 7 isoform X2 [Papaver somniferum]